MIYLLPVNLSLFGMFAMTEHLMVYPYLILVWDILFSTGLHYGIALVYAWYLYRVCLQPSADIPTQEDCTHGEQLQQQQQESSNMEPCVSQLVVQDRITLDPLPKLHITDDNPDVVGIDIADLSSFTHTAEMVYEDDEVSPYDGRFSK